VSRLAVGVVLAAAACQRAPIASCDDDLRGVYVGAEIGATGDERWMILDDGDALEAYPLFADLVSASATEVAPRMIRLARDHGAIAGQVHRRFMQRATACESVAPIHITRCAGDTLELVAGTPAPPLTFSPCTWPAAEPSRAIRWRRAVDWAP
jgi:hypothetical protein